MKFSGEKLRELRKARSWDQHRLASEARSYATGITQASVSRHENGMEPSGRNALAYARALGVDVAELYGVAAAADEEDSSMSLTRDLHRSIVRIVEARLEKERVA